MKKPDFRLERRCRTRRKYNGIQVSQTTNARGREAYLSFMPRASKLRIDRMIKSTQFVLGKLRDKKYPRVLTAQCESFLSQFYPKCLPPRVKRDFPTKTKIVVIWEKKLGPSTFAGEKRLKRRVVYHSRSVLDRLAQIRGEDAPDSLVAREKSTRWEAESTSSARYAPIKCMQLACQRY